MGLSAKEKKLVKQLADKGILNTYELKPAKIPKYRPPKLAPRVKQSDLPPLIMPPRHTKSQEFGNYLLTSASGDKTAAKLFGKSLASRTSAEEEEPGLLSKLFDTLSTGTYLAANTTDAVMDMVDGEGVGENLGQIAKGAVGAGIRLMDATVAQPLEMLPFGIGDEISRTIKRDEKRFLPKRTHSDVLEEHGVENDIVRGIGGFGLDVALDPLTYVGGLGLAGKIGKGGKEATKILDEKAAASFIKPKEIGPARAPRPTRNQLNPPVAEQAVRGSFPAPQNMEVPRIPRQELPPMKPALQPRSRKLKRRQEQRIEKLKARDEVGLSPDLPPGVANYTKKLEKASKDYSRALIKGGTVAHKGRINIEAANTIAARIAEGKVPLKPKVTPATGEIAEQARDIADNFITGMVGKKASSVAGTKIRELTPPMQINLVQKLMGRIDPGVPEDQIAGVLKAAEDHMISLGVQPVWHEGMRVRLSDVIDTVQKTAPEMQFSEILRNFKLKSTRNMDPIVRAALHGVSAERSMHMGTLLSTLTKLTKKASDEASNTTLGTARRITEERAVDTAVRHGIRAGMTYKEAVATKKLLQDVVNVDKLEGEEWLITASRELNKAVDEGRASPELIAAFNKKVANDVGITAQNQLSKITGNRTLDMMMTAVATWWGKGNFQREAQSVFRWAEDSAKSRSRVMRHFVKKYTKDERNEAWKVATGVADSENGRVTELADFINNYFAAVLQSADKGMQLTNDLNKASSVAERSMTTMNDINRHLKNLNGPSAFQFTNSKRSYDTFGNAHNFSDAHDWMKSWILRRPDDFTNYIYDIDLALERVLKEYAFLDNFAYEFGSLTASAGRNFAMPLSRLKGFYVPEEVGRQMVRVMADIDKAHWAPKSPFMKFASKALRAWKTGVTIYLPSHHIRNGIGDLNLMWWAGHNDPRAFTRAKRVMFAQRTRYNQAIKHGDLDKMGRFTDPDAAKLAETSGTDIILKQNGVKVNADQIYVGAFQRGLLPGVDDLEDIFGESLMAFRGREIKPLGGKAHHAATKASEYRDHYIRIAHFTAALNKNLKKGKDLKKAMDEAAFEVRKWHPDGRDLTYFEQKYMRNLVPFYSWLRKSTPLLFETLATRPAKILAYPKGMVALQESMGMDPTMLDPFPDDQAFPEWLRAYGVGPIGDPESENDVSSWWGKLGRNALDIAGNPTGYTMVNPSNPFIDFGAQFLGHGPKDTGGGLLDSLNPFLKVPIDLTKNSDFTGAPITKDEGGQGVLEYLTKQIPLISPVQRLTNAGEEPREGIESNKPLDKEALINILTALQLRGTGPYIKMAEFEQEEKARAREKNR